jgi:transcriptional regulator with XRE-family HTH domain
MKDSHSSTSPLPEHSGGSPENVPSGGRPGDRAEVEAPARLKCLGVRPIGAASSVCEIASGFGGGPPLSVYPESAKGKALRDVRTARGLSLREVASAVSLTCVRLGGLERGRYVLSSEQWDWLLLKVATLEPAALSKPGDRPTTAREAEVMAEAVARAARALLDDEHVLPGAEVIDE